MQQQKVFVQEYHWKFLFSISTSDFFPSNIRNDFIAKMKQVKGRYEIYSRALFHFKVAKILLLSGIGRVGIIALQFCIQIKKAPLN